MAVLVGLLLVLVPACGYAQDGASEPLVFDGRSLAGWEGDGRHWSVEEGCLVGRTSAAEPLARSTYLVWTGGELRDFELTLEYQLVSGNSGVQFRSRVVGAHNVAGYQADLADAQGLTGTLYEQFGRNATLSGLGERTHVLPTGKSERERFASAESLAASLRPGAWNELRIRALGPRCELFVNGVKTSELIDESPLRASLSGCLALQLHSGPPMEVRFRAFRLRQLGGVHDGRERVEPLWIWPTAQPAPGEEAWFQRSFVLPGAARRAFLYAVADDGFEAYLNGELVAAGEGVERTQQVDVGARLRAGENVLALWAHNLDGPAALLASLQAEGEGWKVLFGTDESWRGARSEPRDWLRAGEGWGAVHSFGPIGTEPWPRPANRIQHARLSALPGSEIQVPEGFVAELLYSVPRARQGSWVALTFDERGVGYSADQHGSLYRIELGAAGEAPLVERVDVPLGEAQGLAWAFDALYVVVNRSRRHASGLYRVRDGDGDGRLDTVELLRALEGHDEHGPHAVVFEPHEERLYVVGGNESRPPAEALAAWGPSYPPVGRLPVAVQEVDMTQFELAQQGLSGWVARTDRDGRRWELVAMGLRNAYDLAFDLRGERLYAFDSDMEWDLGLPWYVPTRLLSIVPRADFGFRLGSARWPTWFPDAQRGLLDVGRTSPTGMLGGHGLDLPERYRGAIFAGDWLKGQILAFFPAFDGPEARARVEVFASGKPLPVTDLARGPRGELYFTTGGRHAQSGLYRIRARETREDWPRTGFSRQPLDALFEELCADPELVRRTLAGAEGEARRLALRALETRTDWFDTLASEPDQLVRALLELALARVAPPARVGALLAELAARALPAERERLGIVLRTLELALLRAEGATAETRTRLAATLLARFPAAAPGLERELERQLGVLLASLPEAADEFVPHALARLAGADAAGDGAEAFHWAFVLRHTRSGWSAAGRRQYFAWLRRAEAGFGGGRAVPVYLAALRADALATLSDEERAALGELLEPGTEAELAPSAARPFVRAWSLAELEPLEGELERGRDLVRGQRVLREAACLTCHRIEGRGQARGPELDGLAGRFSAGDLLVSLLEPSREVPERYRETEVWLRAGGVRVGRVLEEREGALYLMDSYGARAIVRIELDEIESRGPSRLSPMPEGLLDTFTREEILDLLGYLLQDG